MPGDYRRPTKTTGLDWAALSPTCKTCSRRDSTVHVETHECATCTSPIPEPKARPVKKARRSPKRRPTQHTPKPPRTPKPPKPRGQYAKPIGPRRQPAGGPNTTTRRDLNESQIVTAYRSGVTAPRIAAQWGTTSKRIRRILTQAGVDLRDDRALHSGGRPRAYPPETRAEVARLYLEGYSRSQVAAELGIPYKTVVTIMTRDGVPARQRQSGRQDGAAALKARIRDLGVTPRDINAWARLAGYPVSRGIPSARVVDAFEQATRRGERVA